MHVVFIILIQSQVHNTALEIKRNYVWTIICKLHQMYRFWKHTIIQYGSKEKTLYTRTIVCDRGTSVQIIALIITH